MDYHPPYVAQPQPAQELHLNLLQKLWRFFSAPNYSRTIGFLAILIVAAGIPLAVYVSQQRQETRQHASGTDGPLQCVPAGGTVSRFDSDTVTVTNNQTNTITFKVQYNLCDYDPSFGPPVPSGKVCNQFQSLTNETLAPGQSKTYTMAPVPSCKVAQIDVYEGTPPSFVPSPDGCYTETGTYWSGGLGFTIKANSTGYPNNCPVTANVDCVVSPWTPAACPTNPGYAGGTVVQTRTITTPQSGTGAACPTLSQSISCPAIPATPASSNTQFSFVLKLGAIGASGENQNPLTTTRAITVQAIDSAGQNSGNPVTGTVVYQATTSAQPVGLFVGTVDMGTSLPAGAYHLKIKTPRHIAVQAPGIQTVPTTTTTALTVPQTTLPAGDVNGDNKVDIADYNIIFSCFENRANSTGCGTNKLLSDLDDNGVVDGVDYNVFVRSLGTQSGD